MIATKTTTKWIRPAQFLMTLTVCMVLVMICQKIVYQISLERVQRIFDRQRSPSATASEAGRSQSHDFLTDGTAVLVSVTKDPISSLVKSIRVADANDHVLYEGPKDKNPFILLSSSRGGAGSFQIATSLSDIDQYYGLNVVFSQMLCVRTVGASLRSTVTWVYDPGLGAFAGYDPNNRIIGYLDGHGLSSRRQEVHPLEKGLSLTRLKKADSPNLVGLWVAAHTVYAIDFDAMTVRQIFHSDKYSVQWIDASRWDDSNGGPFLPSVTIFLGDGGESVYLPDSQRLISIPTASDSLWRYGEVIATRRGLYLQRYTVVGAPPIRDSEAYTRWWRQHENQPIQRITQLMQVQDDGDLTLVSSFELTQHRQIDPSSNTEASWEERVAYAAAMVSPLPTKWVPDRFRYGSWYVMTLIYPFTELDIYAPANLIMTLALAALTFLHAWPRRTGWGLLAFWLAIVLIFNLAGFLTYLALNHTPVIRCPACGRRRGLARADCPECHALLPVPQPRPTDLVLPVT